jgi:hypothetical protein
MNTKTVKTALVAGIPWTIFMLIFYSFGEDGLTSSRIISTVIGGIFFGLLLALSLQYFAKKMFDKIVIETDPSEITVKVTGANHFKGTEGVGGKLLLTDRRLIFKSHKLNIQNHQESFYLHQIKTVSKYKILSFINTGLMIQLTTDEVHKFVVDHPEEWVSLIQNQLSSTLATS